MAMSFSTGSLSTCEKEGAYRVDVSGRMGERRAWTRDRKDGPLKVKGAPRRAKAVLGSGSAESWVRVRGKPSMGMKVERGDELDVAGEWCVCRALRRVEMVEANVVFPGCCLVSKEHCDYGEYGGVWSMVM